MSALVRPAPAMPASAAAPCQLDDLVLARIAAKGGASRAQIVRDLAPLTQPRQPGAQWRALVDTALTRLMLAGKVVEARSRLRLGADGEQAVARFLGEKQATARPWNEQRDVWLVAKGLGVDAGKPALRMALQRPDGLTALFVQHAFGLAQRQALSPSKLRAALALVALERAFGDNVKSGLGKGSALSAKAGRVLAGQLLAKPRELSTDARLVSALCMEKAGLARFDADALRLVVLRRLMHADASAALVQPARPVLRAVPESVSPPPAALTPQLEAMPQRPHLAQFSAGVISAARAHAEGWPGARKAFISRVWEAIRTSHPDWGLSEIEFKDMLAGAHRAGQLVLTGADLKSKNNIKEFEDSAILYKNTVWHYVRVED